MLVKNEPHKSEMKGILLMFLYSLFLELAPFMVQHRLLSFTCMRTGRPQYTYRIEENRTRTSLDSCQFQCGCYVYANLRLKSDLYMMHHERRANLQTKFKYDTWGDILLYFIFVPTYVIMCTDFLITWV